MVYIKANNEIIKVYQSVITSKKERVEWNGDIVITCRQTSFYVF